MWGLVKEPPVRFRQPLCPAQFVYMDGSDQTVQGLSAWRSKCGRMRSEEDEWGGFGKSRGPESNLVYTEHQ